MVEAQSNIMCQDTGKSPVVHVCNNVAVAEVRIQKHPEAYGSNIFVCQSHFRDPSYPILKIISSSVTLNKPITNKDMVEKYSIGYNGWFKVVTIRGARGIPPGTYGIHLVTRRIDTENCEIHEIYSIKGEESA